MRDRLLDLAFLPFALVTLVIVFPIALVIELRG